MSYDLFFTEADITLEQFNDWFESRDKYTVAEGQAFYENENTGVYFGFEYSTEEPDDDFEEPLSSASFNLNFFRPHYFALEAEPEVRSFVDRFGFKVHDPQNNGMGDGDYNTEGFHRGWNTGNEFGYSVFMNSEDSSESIYTRPTDELHLIWKWNFTKEKTQCTFGDNVFVPGIIFIKIKGEILTIVVWPDAIPTLIPQVDALVMPRQELAPRRLFRRKEDLCILPFADALPYLNKYRSGEYPIPAFSLTYASAPTEIADFVKSLKPYHEKMTGVAFDQILNREIVEKYRKQ